MLSRRRFLGFSLAGIATATVGCRPPDFDQIKEPATSLDDDFLNSKAGLSARRQHFLGYPLNLRTPADGFFRWRNELQKVGMGQFSFNNVKGRTGIKPKCYFTKEAHYSIQILGGFARHGICLRAN
jgi:hypothetical protein